MSGAARCSTIALARPSAWLGGFIAVATTAGSCSSTSGIGPGWFSSSSTRRPPVASSARPRAARRGRDHGRRGGGAALARDRQPGASDRRVRGSCRRATLLSDADTPPFEIESFSGEVGEEARLRHRYLDLRRDRMRHALELRHGVVARDARVLRRRGVRRGRDADAHPLHARGGARLPRPEPRCSRAPSTRCRSRRSSSSSF